jgi:transposase
MGIQTYKVKLPDEEKVQLQQIIHGGTYPARVVNRAQVLLNANEGKIDKQIYQSLHIATSTPYDIRKRYNAEGLDRALYDLPRPGQKRKLTGEQEAQIVAIACTEPPVGHDSWTMDMLTDWAHKQSMDISRSAVWKVTLRNVIKPWRKKNVGHTRNNH